MKTIIKLFLLAAISLSNSNSFSQLNGTYTIGTGGNYTTINNAVSAAVTQGVSAPVVFNIMSGVYDEHIIINSIPGSSAANTVTFKSQTGNPDDVKITLTASDYNIIVLNGVENLTIQGVTISNSLNIFRKLQFINNCKNIKIINNIFTRAPSANQGGVDIDGDLFFGAFNLNNILIENNVFEYTGYNIKIASVFSISSNIRIINNIFNGYIIIEMDGCDSVLIEKNRRLSDSLGTLRLINCKFFKISKNIFLVEDRLFDIILVESGDTSSCSIISNNFLPKGIISMNSCINILLIYNSIISQRSHSNYAGIVCTSSSDIVSVNNLSINTVTGYALNANNSGLNSDYNDYYNGGNSNLILHNSTIYGNVSDFYNATGLDEHSNSHPVNFVSTSDLHLTGSSIGDTNLAGISTSFVTDDIDGNPRNPVHPYKGADEPDVPLPIELSSFTATVNRRDVNLIWTTASETNNSGFEIERRIVNEGIPRVWEKVGFVRGSGTTFTPTNYSFKDEGLSTGKYNYRLKQIDLNGNYEYYDLRNEVVIGIKVEYKLSQNYPNPFNPTTKINYELTDDGIVNIKLYDLSGKEIRTILNEAKTAGYYSLEFNAEGLSSGVYIYRMEVDGILKDSKQMILLK